MVKSEIYVRIDDVIQMIIGGFLNRQQSQLTFQSQECAI